MEYINGGKENIIEGVLEHFIHVRALHKKANKYIKGKKTTQHHFFIYSTTQITQGLLKLKVQEMSITHTKFD